MSSSPDLPAGLEPVTLPGRRAAVRSLAGIGAASAALLGLSKMASAHLPDELEGPGGSGLAIKAAKKKGKKKGKHTLVRESDDFSIGAGGTATGQVNCPSGEATGGGAGLTNTACSVISGGPVGSTAWAATVTCPPGQTATVTVTVICLA